MKHKIWHVLLVLACGTLFGTEASNAETITCQFGKFQGHIPLLPKEVSVTTRPNSGAVIVRDDLARSIGQPRLEGEEDANRPNFRRFTWELRDLPTRLIPARQNTAARNIAVFSLSVTKGTGKARLVSSLIIGSASASEGVLNRASGRCKQSK